MDPDLIPLSEGLEAFPSEGGGVCLVTPECGTYLIGLRNEAVDHRKNVDIAFPYLETHHFLVLRERIISVNVFLSSIFFSSSSVTNAVDPMLSEVCFF